MSSSWRGLLLLNGSNSIQHQNNTKITSSIPLLHIPLTNTIQSRSFAVKTPKNEENENQDELDSQRNRLDQSPAERAVETRNAMYGSGFLGEFKDLRLGQTNWVGERVVSIFFFLFLFLFLFRFPIYYCNCCPLVLNKFIIL